MQSPTLERSDALVVMEGTARITWDYLGNGLQTPVGLWPSAHQKEQIDHLLIRRAPMLVILSRTEPTVSLLPEEARWISDELVPLMESDGCFSTVRVPVLDWLPEQLAERGRRFLAECAERAAGVPAPLLPALFIEKGVEGPEWTQLPWCAGAPGPAVDDGCDNVRFACRTSTGLLARHHVDAVAARLFGSDRTQYLAYIDEYLI